MSIINVIHNITSSLIQDNAKNPIKIAYRTALQNFIIDNKIFIGNNVLDIGSGQWDWTKVYLGTRLSKKVISFDIVTYPNIDITGNIFQIERYFKPQTFDTAICTDVIEHVPYPDKAIRKIHYILKPKGTLLLSCPFDKELHGEDYGDYWRITRQGWNLLLKDKFRNIEISWLGEEIKPKAYFVKAIKI